MRRELKDQVSQPCKDEVFQTQEEVGPSSERLGVLGAGTGVSRDYPARLSAHVAEICTRSGRHLQPGQAARLSARMPGERAGR